MPFEVRPAIDGGPVQIELGHAARSRVTEPGVDGAVELRPEAPADRRDEGDLRERERRHPAETDHRDRATRDGRAERAQKPAAVARHDLDEPGGCDDSEQLVPFEEQRARVVRGEFEPPALEPLHLARDPIAVGENDDVGFALSVHAAAQGTEHDTRQRQPPQRAATRSRAAEAWAAQSRPAPMALSWSPASRTDCRRARSRCRRSRAAPRTLLPAASSGGETTAMPNLPGDTAIRPPPTPLFAGQAGVEAATCRSRRRGRRSPSRRACRARWRRRCTCLPVTGFLPPLASVAAIDRRGPCALTPIGALPGVDVGRLLPGCS